MTDERDEEGECGSDRKRRMCDGGLAALMAEGRKCDSGGGGGSGRGI